MFSLTDVALDREVEGDLLLGDMGQGMPFRPGTFDGCIRYLGAIYMFMSENTFFIFFLTNLFVSVSISALQWLCNADKKTHSPPKRLHTFFSSLYSSLVSF